MSADGLMAACRRGDLEFLRLYVRRHRNVRRYQITDNHRWGPLHHAVVSNSLACVELLLSLSRFIDPRRPTFEGQTSLMIAIDRQVSPNIIRALLRRDTELFNIPNNEQVYPIHLAIERNNFEIVRALIETMRELGRSVQQQVDLEGEHSLHIAARHRNEQIINYLIENTEMDYRHRNANGLTALSTVMVPGDVPHPPNDREVLRIIQRLFPLTHDMADETLIEELMMPMALCCHFSNHITYTWFFTEFYMNEYNDHHDLVRRAFASALPVDSEYKKMLLGLHSKLQVFLVDHNDSWRNELVYRELWSTLCALYYFNVSLFLEITAVLTNKLDRQRLNMELLEHLPKQNLDPNTATHFVRMFDLMGAAPKLDIRVVLQRVQTTEAADIVYQIFMPFSSAPTPSVYSAELLRPRGDIVPPVNDSLMAMCRDVIRKRILRGNELFAVKLELFRTLGVPESVFNYLLYNQTDHKFPLRPN